MPPPKWVDLAVQAAIVDRRTKAEEQRHYIAKLHYLRWDIVADMRKRDRASSPRKHRLSWQRCYDAASDALAETEARGSSETIKKSYQAVQRDMREGRRAKYSIALR